MKKLSLVIILALLVILLMPVVPVSAGGNEPPTDALYFSRLKALRNSHYNEHWSSLYIYVTNPTDAPITTDVDFWVYCAENSNLKEYSEEAWEIAAYSTEMYLYQYDVHNDPGFYWFVISSEHIAVDVVGYMNEIVDFSVDICPARSLDTLLFIEVAENANVQVGIGRPEVIKPYSVALWVGSVLEYLFEGNSLGTFRSWTFTPDIIGEILVNVQSTNLGYYDTGIAIWVDTYGEVDLVCNKLYSDYRIQLIDEYVVFYAEIENIGTAYGTVAISLYITDTDFVRTEYTTKNVSFGIGEKKLVRFKAYQVEVIGGYLADVLDAEFAFFCTNEPMFVDEYDPDEEVPSPGDDDDEPWIPDPVPFIEFPAGLGDMAKAFVVLIMMGGVGFSVERAFKRRWLSTIAGVGTLALMVWIGWCPIWLTIAFALLLSFIIIKKVVHR